jgi:polar amino acid transport system permease protein
MNLAPWTVLGRIVLPQAWRVILPPSIVHVLSMVKETSLVSQIGFIEITFAAKILTQRGFSALLTYGSALVLYFLIGWALAALGRWSERRLTSRTPASPRAASPLPSG